MPTAAKTFLSLAALACLTFSVLLPPFQAPDEGYHFLRAYQLSEGKFREGPENGQPGTRVPRSLVEFLSAFARLPLRPQAKTSAGEILAFRNLAWQAEDRVFFPFAQELPHPSLPYWPQALGIFLGRTLGLGPFYCFYLGRLANAGVWISLLLLALRATPIQRWLWALLALTPMTLQQAASLSPDAFTNGLAFLLVAWILNLSLNPEPGPLGARRLAAPILGSLAFTLSKVAYAPHALLFLLLPPRKFSSRPRYLFSVGGAILLNGLLGLAFLHHSGMGTWPEVQAQREILLNQPGEFLKIFALTFWHRAPLYLWQWIGWLGHLDTPLPLGLALGYGTLLLFVAWRDRNAGPPLLWKAKALLGGISLLEITIIWTGLFLTWNQPGAAWIHGGQGRYLIPIAPLLGLLGYRPAGEAGETAPSLLRAAVLVASLAGLGASYLLLVRRYYGLS
ncbi:MAG: DUF2142 domain-containing protein [bacterium]